MIFSCRSSGWPGLVTLLGLMVLGLPLTAQTLRGTVREADATGVPLPGASVRWLATKSGTATDSDGNFALVRSLESRYLVVSFVGYQSDTLLVADTATFLAVSLQPSTQLQEVEVSGSGGTFIDDGPQKVEVLTTRELAKAPCCNLAESFETNASVDVSYSDAASGARQVQMLGLDGSYVQFTTEGLPSIRGLALPFGLQMVPGPWINAIEIGKGVGSVLNGYESMSGHINVELQKPDKGDRLLFNGFGNHMGRLEANLNLAHTLSPQWSSGLLLHASTFRKPVDHNRDGFLDMPLFTQYNVLNRWTYSGKRWQSQFGVRAVQDERTGGQDPEHLPPNYGTDTVGHGGHLPPDGLVPLYRTGTRTRRLETFGRLARLFPGQPYRRLGLAVAASRHEQDSYFGQTPFAAQENSLHVRLLYGSLIGTNAHTFRLVASFLLNDYREAYAQLPFWRREYVPGVGGEYTFTGWKGLTAVAGLRTDYHSLYGFRTTPRLHLKYELGPQTTVRASAGSGWRVANPLPENMGVLVSNRAVVRNERLLPEHAWNYGLNVTHSFRLADRPGTLGLDLYRTDFTNQVITDLDTDPRAVYFYNLRGKSFGNNLQVEAGYRLAKGLDVRLAYKFYDVKSDYNGQLLQRPLISRHKGLLNLAYATRFDKWRLDFTTQWIGPKRLPSTEGIPAAYQAVGTTPAYFLLMGQVTRTFKRWEVYVGGENLTNYVQPQPILGQPYTDYFDAGRVWAPMFGRMAYAGFRHRIK